MHLHDSVLLRFCVSRFWDFDKIIPDLYVHLQWRQTNIPVPMLQDRTLILINKGLWYIHGRCMDGSPIMVFNLGVMAELFANNLLDNGNFSNLHNFFANYIMMNMHVPGQCEKWVLLANLNGFNISQLPVNMFKKFTREGSTNYIDYAPRINVV